jgi:hypothetical protein
VRDALVDLNPSTKNLPSAHFDSESFADSNRQKNYRLFTKYYNYFFSSLVMDDASNPNKDLDKACGRIGDVLHTLQDFYSHSNSIEMGEGEINDPIGIQEDIGQIAGINQATCTSDGCARIQTKCVGLILYCEKC